MTFPHPRLKVGGATKNLESFKCENTFPPRSDLKKKKQQTTNLNIKHMGIFFLRRINGIIFRIMLKMGFYN